ncbi:MAG: energy-coupling factor transporter transmembrane component T [Candidatus Limnocylindrales bacterium]
MTRPGPTAWHRLNPLTKLTLATVTSLVAVIWGGIVAPLGLLAVVVIAPAVLAGVLPRLIRTSLLLSLPIAISAFVVNLFFFPGATDVLFALGPIKATREGLAFALEILARILTISGSLTLFYLTTRPADLVLDLERRGVSPRIAFVINASVQTVPRMVERAETIIAAQRARGLDTEGSIWQRIRGVVPIVGPVIMSSIGEVEQRTMALEARGFTRPGRRTLLWSPRDTGVERLTRWLIVLAVPLVVIARTNGWLG